MPSPSHDSMPSAASRRAERGRDRWSRETCVCCESAPLLFREVEPRRALHLVFGMVSRRDDGQLSRTPQSPQGCLALESSGAIVLAFLVEKADRPAAASV